MTVRELKFELDKYDPDLQVQILWEDDMEPVEIINAFRNIKEDVVLLNADTWGS